MFRFYFLYICVYFFHILTFLISCIFFSLGDDEDDGDPYLDPGMGSCSPGTSPSLSRFMWGGRSAAPAPPQRDDGLTRDCLDYVRAVLGDDPGLDDAELADIAVDCKYDHERTMEAVLAAVESRQNAEDSADLFGADFADGMWFLFYLC